MVHLILEEARRIDRRTAYLKQNSPYYPEVFINEGYNSMTGRESSVSTFVRIERNNKWYAIHCVESNVNVEAADVNEQLLMRLMRSAYLIQNFYVVNDDEIDFLQESEEERLRIKI